MGREHMEGQGCRAVEVAFVSERLEVVGQLGT
jgi:hypothetical protein